MPTPLAANLYNPHEQSKEELIQRFVVRHKLFQQLLQDIKTSDMTYPEPHYLIEGQRGMGKTTLLLRLSYEVENDPELNSWLVPVVLKEEAYYGVTKLLDLWQMVAQALETKEHNFIGLTDQLKRLNQQSPEAERAGFAILSDALAKHSKKLLLCIDNFGEMVQQLSDQESHRFREILMTCSRLRLVATSNNAEDSFFAYTHPLYEFFKVKHLDGVFIHS